LRISPSGSLIQDIDIVLRYKGMGRHTALTVNQLVLAPAILKGTNLILTTYGSLVKYSQLFEGLEVYKLPLKLEPIRIQLLWHAVEDKDPAAAWLRAQITKIGGEFQDARA